MLEFPISTVKINVRSSLFLRPHWPDFTGGRTLPRLQHGIGTRGPTASAGVDQQHIALAPAKAPMGVAKQRHLRPRLFGSQAQPEQAQLHTMQVSMGHVKNHPIDGSGQNLVLIWLPAMTVAASAI